MFQCINFSIITGSKQGRIRPCFEQQRPNPGMKAYARGAVIPKRNFNDFEENYYTNNHFLHYLPFSKVIYHFYRPASKTTVLKSVLNPSYESNFIILENIVL